MKNFLFLASILSLLLLSACTDAKIQSLEEFYKEAEIETIDQIVIQDGSTGASKTITEQQQIDEFLSLINDTVFSPQSNQEDRNGWRYAIHLFEGEKEFNFTLNKIGNIYYDSTPDIYPIVDNYYNNVEIEEH